MSPPAPPDRGLDATRYLILRGPESLLRTALDRCFVRGDVLGVVERQDGHDLEHALEIELVLGAGGAGILEADRYVLGPDGVTADLLDVAAVAERARAAQSTGLEADAPVFVSAGIMVRAPWVAQPAEFRGVTLVVPRGGAFGSGEDASTQVALLAVAAAMESAEGSPARWTVVDVGTGTGILSLLALELGAPQVLACDIDPPSVRAARELLCGAGRATTGSGRVRLTLSGADAIADGVADLVVANLTAAELTAALPDLLRIWRRTGPLVLAGMRPAQVAGVVRLLPRDVSLRTELRRGEFVARVYDPAGA